MNLTTTGPKIFHSKENLTIRLADYSNVYLFPAVCAFGMFTSVVNILVSRSLKTNDKIMKYIFVNSVVDCAFLLTQFFLVIVRCGTLCPYSNAYASKFYEIYVYLYAGYVLVTFQLIWNTFESINRLSAFSVKHSFELKTNSAVFYASCFGAAVVINMPLYLFSKEVTVLGLLEHNVTANTTLYETLYMKKTRDFFQTKILQTLLSVTIIIMHPLLYSIFSLISIVLAFKFKRFMAKKHKLVMLKHNSSGRRLAGLIKTKDGKVIDHKECNFTAMTLMYCFVYILGNFIDSFGMILDVYLSDVYVTYGILVTVGNTIFFASHSVNLFVYSAYNVPFRRSLRRKCTHLMLTLRTFKLPELPSIQRLRNHFV